MDKIEELTTKQLQSLLKARGLSYRYRFKTDLIERLKKAVGAEDVANFEGVESDIEITEGSGEESEGHDQEIIDVAGLGELENGSSGPEEESSLEDPNECAESGNADSDNLDRTILNNVETSKNFCPIKIRESISKMPETESKPNTSPNSFLFKDVEESLETFRGESGKDVITWFKDFEDIANVCLWNDIQRYLYARRLLEGAAKLSVEASTGIRSWKELKEHLTKEFSSTTTSISIHRALERRKKERHETYLEYMYSMKAIANRGQVDEESLVAYIVAGIPDEVLNKTVLYEATSFDDLKTKFKVYEAMKTQGTIKKCSKPEQRTTLHRGKPNQSFRCFNCGSKSHITNSCPHKTKGSRCFNCDEFGHIATNCTQPKRNSRNSQDRGQVNLISTPDLHIKVTINGKEFLALVDTGSDVTLVRETVKNTLRISKSDEGPSTFLAGFGRYIRRTTCSFTACIQIDNEDYQVKFHVVPDSWLPQDILLGKDIMKDVTLVIAKGKVTIRKEKVAEVRNDENNFLEKIDVVQLIEETRLDCVDDISDKTLQSIVRSFIETYAPIKPSKSCIQMSITLENEKPVYYKPRRLAPQERQIVSQQIQQWLDEGIIRHSRSDFASPVVLAKKITETLYRFPEAKSENIKGSIPVASH